MKQVSIGCLVTLSLFLYLLAAPVVADVSDQAIITDQAMIADQPMIGEMAPAFALLSVAHGEISSADLGGNWMVIHIAASW